MDKKIDHQDFWRILRLVYDTAPAVLAAFLDSKILEKNLYFKSFLEQIKHSLYHKYISKGYCCKCSDKTGCSTNNMQNFEYLFWQLFQTEKALLNKSHVVKTGSSKKVCICQFTPNGKSSSDFDIVALVLLLTEGKLVKDHEHEWLRKMKDLRNRLFHLSGTRVLTPKQYEGIWNELENVIKTVARKVGPGIHYLHSVEREIEYLKTSNTTEEQIRPALQKVTGTLEKINDKIDEHEHILTQIQDEQHSNLLQNINDIDENPGSSIAQLQEGHNILLLDRHRNVIVSATVNSMDTVSEIVDLKCIVDVPKKWNEHAIVKNMPSTSKVQMAGNDLYCILASEERCITLRLAIKRNVFENAEALHSVIRSLLQKIINAGDIDANDPAFVSFRLELYIEENTERSYNATDSHENSQMQTEIGDVKKEVLKETGNTDISFLLSHSKQIVDNQDAPLEASTIGILTQMVLDVFPDIIREWLLKFTTEECILENMTGSFFRDKIYKSLKDCNFPTLLEGARYCTAGTIPFMSRYQYKYRNDSEKKCIEDIHSMEKIYDRIIGTGSSVINQEERYQILREIKEIIKHFDEYFEKKHFETYEGRFEYLISYWGFAQEMYSVLDKFGLSFLYPQSEPTAQFSRRQYAEPFNAFTMKSTDSGHFSDRSGKKEQFDDDGTIVQRRQTKRPTLPTSFFETGSSES